MIRHILVIGAILITAFFILGILFSERLDLIASNPSPLVRHFAPTWRSLKKILDIPYVITSIFRSSDLPVYHITLSASDRAGLIDNLPDYPREYKLTEDFKDSVRGEFRFGNYYTNDARMRYRGVSPNHWDAVKKSLQVNLPQEYPLGSREILRFFIPEDKGLVFGKLSEYRAQKLGLLTPKVSFAWLVVNKIDMGIYYLIEGWEENFLVRHNRPPGPIFANENIITTGVDLYHAESINLWEDRLYPDRPGHEYEALAYFLELVENASNEEFETALPYILNLPKFYQWMLIATLSNSFHQGNIANQNVYFNEADGKLEQISFDTALVKIEGPIDLSNNRLVNRMMRIHRFRNEFTTVARKYLNNPSNLSDDLALYDKVKKEILGAILDDTKKVQTSFEILPHIDSERDIVEHNFLALKEKLEHDGELSFSFAEESYPLTRPFAREDYKTFSAIYASRNEFLAAHPKFIAGNDSQSIVLAGKMHHFTKDVIVPTNLVVTIQPGARLLFAPGASFISYSPVKARGVYMSRLVPDAPWGVFALINAPEESVFENITADGGKDDTINGIYLSGMLSFHNSDVRIDDSVFSNSGADDAVHVQTAHAVIKNSRFENSASDAIDIDFARGTDSFFEGNTFRNAGGDAMDLSFSEMTIRNNTVTDCGDKGVSVGEASRPVIENITVTRCLFGIAVKDRSHAIISDSSFEENDVGIGLYRKKPFFVEGGTAEVRKSAFKNNKEKTTADEFSSIEIYEE